MSVHKHIAFLLLHFCCCWFVQMHPNSFIQIHS